MARPRLLALLFPAVLAKECFAKELCDLFRSFILVKTSKGNAEYWLDNLIVFWISIFSNILFFSQIPWCFYVEIHNTPPQCLYRHSRGQYSTGTNVQSGPALQTRRRKVSAARF